MPAILFGSISTLSDTSEMQREAFNAAFKEHGLDWEWSREEYLPLLETSGGQNRIEAYAKDRGEDVDVAAIHATKSEIFQRRITETGAEPRPGVAETIEGAKAEGVKIGLVTGTSRANSDALLGALGDLGTQFDLVTDDDAVGTPKPDKAAYAYALDQLGEDAGHCVAIEDNLAGVESAQQAGVRCLAFPNQNTAGHDFTRADEQVDRLDADQLRALVA